MYKLYYSPAACSMAVHIALLECKQQVELEQVDTKKPSPEFLKANPLGAVPTLIEDGQPMVEGGAILMHLMDKFQNPLMPRSGKERMAAMQWLMFCNATMHPAYSRCFFLKRNASDEKLMDASIAGVNQLWDAVEQNLSQHPFLAGNEMTIADILLTVIANWSPMLPRSINFGPHTKSLLQKVIARPSYQKAMEVEKVEYKVAA